MPREVLLALLLTTLHAQVKTSTASALQNISINHDEGGSAGDDDELNLVNYLFDGYNKNVRPVEDKSLPVEVKFGIAYTQVVDLNEKDQLLSSNIWVRMIWYNHLLRWNASNFGGIDSINVSPTKVWLPDIVLHNNANNKILPGGTLYMFKTRIILNSDGKCTWYAPTILGSGCNIDITYFPFDEQRCELKFGSWTYNGLQVNIIQMLDQADLSGYMESSEFELVSARAKRNVVTYSCCPEPYPDLTFTIHLRRHPGFYMFNIIIPTIVLTSLAVLTFLLPPEFGERVTLVIEAFLAMSVIIVTVADSIPVTSDATPIIVRIILASLFQVGGSLIANCIVLNSYKKHEMPDWVRVILLNHVARCLWIDTGSPDNEIGRKREYSVETLQRQSTKLAGAKPFKPENFDLSASTLALIRYRKSPRSPDEKLTDGICELAQQAIREEEMQYGKEFRIFASEVIDRIFLILFCAALVISSLTMFSQIPTHYR